MKTTEVNNGGSLERDVRARHTCLLCACGIPETEIYCSNCETEVWATRGNAEHGSEHAAKWERLWAKIQRLSAERKRPNIAAQRQNP